VLDLEEELEKGPGEEVAVLWGEIRHLGLVSVKNLAAQKPDAWFGQAGSILAFPTRRTEGRE
jgi:hypothetical protein